jgi:transporter family-2 protein
MKMSNTIVLIVPGISALTIIPFQSAMNSAMGKHLQSLHFSALSVFIIAIIGLTLYIMIKKQTIPDRQHF